MTALGIVNLPLFMLTVFLLNVTPGPDTAYIVGRSVSQGRAAGLLSALGVSAGCCVHVLAVAFGLTALLAASTVAFTVIKVVGAAYLIYLGGRMLLAPPERDDAPVEEGEASAAKRPRPLKSHTPRTRRWRSWRWVRCSLSCRRSGIAWWRGWPPASRAAWRASRASSAGSIALSARHSLGLAHGWRSPPVDGSSVICGEISRKSRANP